MLKESDLHTLWDTTDTILIIRFLQFTKSFKLNKF